MSPSLRRFLIPAIALAFALPAADRLRAADAGSDSPVVQCHDPVRNLVKTTLRGDCDGEIVSAEEAERLRDSRRRRVIDAMRPAPPPVPEGRKLASIGTGFFVAGDGTVLTNNHVVDGCRDLTVEMTTGEKVPGTVLATDPRFDLAIVTSAAKPPSTVVFRNPTELPNGARADLVGYPNQGIAPIQPFFTNAEVMEGNAEVSVPRTHFLINGDVRQGNSGGPVLDEAGMAVGVIFAKANTPKIFEETGRLVRNVGIAVRNDVVLAFLAENGVTVERRASGTPLPREGVLEAARPFIVRVGCWK